MSDVQAGLKWGVERKLEFIEFRLFWEGGVNRSDIMEMFGVSVQQASKDLTLYQEQAPGNAVYDKSGKRYVVGESFEPRFLKPDPDAYLSRLRAVADGLTDRSDSWIRQVPEYDVAVTPKRDVDPVVLRAVLAAVREGRSINVLYQSMNRERPEPIWRRITPHAFGFDSFRWHARAFCHLNLAFKDFLLPRVLEVGDIGVPGAPASEDAAWNTYIDVVIKPHPGLTAAQQTVVAKDYGMADHSSVLKVRIAMLFYVLKRLGLLGDAEKATPHTQHIVLANKPQVDAVLDRTKLAV